MKFSAGDFAPELPRPANERWIDGVWDVEAFRANSVRLEYFAPRGTDRQAPHEKDEMYFIISGSGQIEIGPERFDFVPGDAFFVAAGTIHRFADFSDDFACWALFF